MNIRVLKNRFSICKVIDYSLVDLTKEFTFTAGTDEEKSLVCQSEHVPINAITRDNGWRCFRIEGTLDFSLVGILAGISSLLAENSIGIFAISTYNTDYIFTKEENLDEAIKILLENKYKITGDR